MRESQVELCARAIAERLGPDSVVVVLTGAGLSAESGLPTFRGAGGLLGDPEFFEAFTADLLRRAPRAWWEIFQRLRELLSEVRPSPAHLALSDLEELLRPHLRLVIITQNVDGLHQVAGNRRVLELHGSARRYYCTCCGRPHVLLPERIVELPPRCACGGVIRPAVVLFGEATPHEVWQEAYAAAQRASVMLVVGTSLQVEPAASLPAVALHHRALVVEVNPETTPLSGAVRFSFRAFASHFLPLLVERLRGLLAQKMAS